MLILAGISINMLTGDNSILTKAGDAKKATDEAAALEEIQLEVLGSYNSRNNDYQALKKNLERLGITNLYNEEIYPIYINYKSYDFKIDRHWEVTKANEIVYQAKDLTFNGTSDYINTGIKLFDEENFNKNFQIRIIVDEFGENIGDNCTLINAKKEVSSLRYPGFVLRTVSKGEKVNISANGTTGRNSVNYETSELDKKLITITRISGNLYCSINGEIEWLYNANDLPKFDTPVTIGCALDENGNPFRFIDAKISKVEIVLTDDDMDVEEPQLIYAKLYNDGTLSFSSEDEIIQGKNLTKDYGIVYNRSYDSGVSSESDLATTTLVPWFDERSQIQTVVFLDEIRPLKLSAWFANCENLTRFENIENLDTTNVTNMNNMFYNCQSLTSLNLSNFNTSKVTTMYRMFGGCIKLKKLNLSSFDTSVVTNMRSMFDAGANDLKMDIEEIDLSGNFKTNNVTDMEYMFSHCQKLERIYIKESFNIEKVQTANEMFKECYKLVGGNGTTYSSSKMSKTYARIDGGPTSSTPGYFTYKSN